MLDFFKNNIFKPAQKNISQFTQNLVDKAKLTEHTFVLIIAVIIGLVGGYGAVFIQYLIQKTFFCNFLNIFRDRITFLYKFDNIHC